MVEYVKNMNELMEKIELPNQASLYLSNFPDLIETLGEYQGYVIKD
jgi:hypothetical protein